MQLQLLQYRILFSTTWTLATTMERIDRYRNNDSRSLRADMAPRQPGSQCHASCLLLLWFFCDGVSRTSSPSPRRLAQLRSLSGPVVPTGKFPARMPSSATIQFIQTPNTRPARPNSGLDRPSCHQNTRSASNLSSSSAAGRPPLLPPFAVANFSLLPSLPLPLLLKLSSVDQLAC